MNRWIITALVATLLVSASNAPVDAEQPDQVAEFMRAKLNHSQDIVEGLTMEQFELITNSAQQLSLLSLAAGWQVLQTPEYADYSRKFRRSTEALKEAGTANDLDKALGAYFEVTAQCVICHKYVRSVKTAAVVPGLSELYAGQVAQHD